MIVTTAGFDIESIRIQELFAAHTPQEDFLTRMCRHYYCDFLSVAKLQKTPDNRIETFLHTHEAYEFLIPLEPAQFIVQDGVTYLGEVGYVYTLLSGKPHGIQAEYENLSNYSITVSKAFTEQRLAEKGLATVGFRPIFHGAPELNILLRLFITEFEKGASADRIDLNLLGSLIVSCLIESGCRTTADDQIAPSQPYSGGIKDAMAYINQHFTEAVTIDRLAEISGFSRNYFITLFKKTTGISPYEHIQILRISKAKVLLENTQLSIAEIAAECGFEKSNSFTSVFKKKTGSVPTDYRKMIKEAKELQTEDLDQ